MKFTKMQGCGNDYVYINCFEQTVLNPEQLAIKVSNRNFGVGSDGLILIMPSKIADCKMRMFNWDGSEAEMCGNGIRCVAKFVYDKKIVRKTQVSVETLAGVKKINIEKDANNMAKEITVNMGEPIFEPNEIPIISDFYIKDNIVKNIKLNVFDKEFELFCLSMGNPHAVTFVDDVENFDVEKYGKFIENHKAFPKKTNVEFIQIIDENNIKMRVWERGSGETLACGTGACASVVSTYLNKKTKRQNVNVELLGGNLKISWNEKDNCVYMTGEAKFVFEGYLYLD